MEELVCRPWESGAAPAICGCNWRGEEKIRNPCDVPGARGTTEAAGRVGKKVEGRRPSGRDAREQSASNPRSTPTPEDRVGGGTLGSGSAVSPGHRIVGSAERMGRTPGATRDPRVGTRRLYGPGNGRVSLAERWEELLVNLTGAEWVAPAPRKPGPLREDAAHGCTPPRLSRTEKRGLGPTGISALVESPCDAQINEEEGGRSAVTVEGCQEPAPRWTESGCQADDS